MQASFVFKPFIQKLFMGEEVPERAHIYFLLDEITPPAHMKTIQELRTVAEVMDSGHCLTLYPVHSDVMAKEQTIDDTEFDKSFSIYGLILSSALGLVMYMSIDLPVRYLAHNNLSFKFANPIIRLPEGDLYGVGQPPPIFFDLSFFDEDL